MTCRFFSTTCHAAVTFLPIARLAKTEKRYCHYLRTILNRMIEFPTGRVCPRLCTRETKCLEQDCLISSPYFSTTLELDLQTQGYKMSVRALCFNDGNISPRHSLSSLNRNYVVLWIISLIALSLNGYTGEGIHRPILPSPLVAVIAVVVTYPVSSCYLCVDSGLLFPFPFLAMPIFLIHSVFVTQCSTRRRFGPCLFYEARDAMEGNQASSHRRR